MNDERIFIRLFAEVVDLGDAAAIAERVKARLSRFGSMGQANVGPYWKIPAYFEVYVCGTLGQDASECFESVLEAFGTGWQTHGSGSEKWAIWNAAPVTSFFAPEVRWANVECFTDRAAGG